jgi:hypothetical protein
MFVTPIEVVFLLEVAAGFVNALRASGNADYAFVLLYLIGFLFLGLDIGMHKNELFS